MSVFYPHHSADHKAMCGQHNEFTDTVSDAVMRIQDEAYELGRQRGKKEADAELLAAAQKALAECCDLAETEAGRALTAAIAKATGSAQ